MAHIGTKVDTVRVPKPERAPAISPTVPTVRENPSTPPGLIPLPQELDFISVPVRRGAGGGS